jgi:two-component system phosphate regulon response regulator PhoB
MSLTTNANSQRRQGELRKIMADNLTADGLCARTAGSTDATRALLSQDPVDLLLVDVNGHTLELLDALRGGELPASSPDTPALVLTGTPDQLHRVRLLERGADDVLLKPFSYPELHARLRALLRHTRPAAAPRVVKAVPVSIDPHTRTAHVRELVGGGDRRAVALRRSRCAGAAHPRAGGV